jgi:hypothetical protein
VKVEPIKTTTRPRHYTEADLCVRTFYEERAGGAVRPGNLSSGPGLRLQPPPAGMAAACDLSNPRTPSRKRSRK